MTPMKEQEIIKLIDEKIEDYIKAIPGHGMVLTIDVIEDLKEIREMITGEDDAIQENKV